MQRHCRGSRWVASTGIQHVSTLTVGANPGIGPEAPRPVDPVADDVSEWLEMSPPAVSQTNHVKRSIPRESRIIYNFWLLDYAVNTDCRKIRHWIASVPAKPANPLHYCVAVSGVGSTSRNFFRIRTGNASTRSMATGYAVVLVARIARPLDNVPVPGRQGPSLRHRGGNCRKPRHRVLRYR